MKINGINLTCLMIDFATKSIRGWAFATIKCLRLTSTIKGILRRQIIPCLT
jgi:hypothetical protein